MNEEEMCQRSNIKGYDLLESLALNIRSSWNHCADHLWRQLEPEIWDLTRNPWAVLQTVSRDKLRAMLSDPTFSGPMNDLVKKREDAFSAPSWFQQNHSKSPLTCVAYFSMEYMLSEALPIYSGGLGNVAGDQLKAASDLGAPVVAIGLLYAQGYFRQFIDKDGEQRELYPYNDPGQLPIKPLRLPNGEWLRIRIDLPGYALWLRTWEVRVGRRMLYLLDSNDISNEPFHRGITSELYGGDKELRLKQEIVLGIGGWRLLEALGITPEVCHMNEGHASFVVLERAFSFMKKTKKTFDAALTATRAGNLFTTHTAVAAGFDRFSPDLVARYLGNYAEAKLGIPIEELLELGQIRPGDDFNMAILAIRGSGFVNGVSQLHRTVSQHLFRDLFPRFPEKEVPIDFVTNGIHVPSWDSAPSDELWEEACGHERWLGKTDELGQTIRTLPDTKIWDMRTTSRSALVDYARTRLARQFAARGASLEEIEKAKSFLDPNALTLGFARRFAEYKRPNLLLLDEGRFLKILTQKERPVQLIIAGKAHPADGEGHALIRQWMQFINKSEVRASVIFLSDYDMILTEYLVQGVDVWINTPRRPWEASGTSGMKVLVNGGLNLSELDGWWAESYSPEVGWALGDRGEHGNDPNWDRQEAYALYDILEQKVIPEFYTRDSRAIPTSFIAKIRESMARLTPQFSSNRVVREYTEKFYLKAAENYLKRAEKNGELAERVIALQSSLQRNWNNLRFGEVKVENGNYEVGVFLPGVDPKDIQVELYSEAMVRQMKYLGPIPNQATGHTYRIEMPKDVPASHFTPRIIPKHTGMVTPLECPLIQWQK
jgi:starch phosphorylase